MARVDIHTSCERPVLLAEIGAVTVSAGEHAHQLCVCDEADVACLVVKCGLW